MQHFPITLNRRSAGPGVRDADFRFPRMGELEALEVFQQSLLLPGNVDDPNFDPFAAADDLLGGTQEAVKRGASCRCGQTGIVAEPTMTT